VLINVGETQPLEPRMCRILKLGRLARVRATSTLLAIVVACLERSPRADCDAWKRDRRAQNSPSLHSGPFHTLLIAEYLPPPALPDGGIVRGHGSVTGRKKEARESARHDRCQRRSLRSVAVGVGTGIRARM
jgi:hypothetical protein